MKMVWSFVKGAFNWIDTHSVEEQVDVSDDRPWKVHMRLLAFWVVHLMCLGVIWVGWSPAAVGVAAALYVLRMFAITGFYHRYFSHKTFRASRLMQFVLALWGGSAAQRGPLWWAAHHRHHHRYSDGPEDPHSPGRLGFWQAQVLWLGKKANLPTKLSAVKDLAKYPELRFLDRFDLLAPVALAVGCFYLGVALEHFFPASGTNGMQMLIWGFFVSTVVLFHGTSTINSLGHLIGRPRYATGDDSKNSWILAFITLGEGWHNNHHYFQSATRQGFYWWEIDITYYGLWLMSKLGLISDLKPVPRRVRDARPQPKPIKEADGQRISAGEEPGPASTSAASQRSSRQPARVSPEDLEETGPPAEQSAAEPSDEVLAEA